MRKEKVVFIAIGIAASVWAVPVLDLEFSSGEGFVNGPVNGIQGMNAQSGWKAADTEGAGYLSCSTSYNRALNYKDFSLDIGHSVIIETTMRLQFSGGAFSDGDYFKIGFAENAQHAGANTPSIGSSVHALADGSYWFGASGVGEAISIPASSSNDWITFTQTISRRSENNEFYGNIHAYNETTSADLGTSYFSWLQNTDDGSWGGSMRPSFRAWGLPGTLELQVDRWAVTTSNGAPLYVTNAPPPVVTNGVVHILIDPEVSISIDGHLQLDRKQFFSLADPGRDMSSRTANPTTVDYYINDLGMNFGRELGGAYGTTGWSGSVREDSERAGYVDMTYLENNLSADNGSSPQWMIDHFSPNLDVATHDRYGSVPSFMDTWSALGDEAGHEHAVNTNAYAEYIAGVLEYDYTAWTRPATYEIVNEPHYNVIPDQRFADLHTAVNRKVDEAGLNVAVGGPCMSVGYFYKNNYQNFGLAPFINQTDCSLDFYSFHVYDFMHFDEVANDFRGRVSTGLPTEGVLDMIQNYTLLNHDKMVDIVLSEHGGYISDDQEVALDLIANTYFPSNSFEGTGFEWEMKRRSVAEQLAVSSAIGNTMTFMNHPHVVRKAVPFILLESASWDPRYYSTLLVKENFDPASSVWHESTYINFFKFFQDVQGRRVRILMEDPDIQCQSYAADDKLYILLNNLAEKPEEILLDIPTSGRGEITLRRYGRNADFTPYFSESIINTLEGLQIGSREALALVVDYADGLKERLRLNEVPHYADQCRQSFSGSKTFNMIIPEFDQAKSAMLRIGVGRGGGTDQDLEILFNGAALEVPMEDCSDYLESGEYGSTKLIPLPVELLQSNNTIEVSFPFGGSGGIGAVVVRTSQELSGTGNAFGINCAGVEYSAGDGTVYLADQNFTASNVGTDGMSAFGNTTDDALYKNERFAISSGSFSYNIPLENGEYNVTLHLAENWFEESGSRTFDVAVEGVNVISGLDLYAEVGRANALDQTFGTTVLDGSLDIDFSSGINNAKINAIRIAPATVVPPGPVYSQWVLDLGLSGTNAIRSVDVDGDGFDTFSEFVAGTDPDNVESFLFVNEIAMAGDDYAITFDSVLQRGYAVEAAAHLADEWTVLTNGISGSGNLIEWIDETGSSKRFYRVNVEVE